MVVGSDLAELMHLSEWGRVRTPVLAPAPQAGGDLLMAFGGQVWAKRARTEHTRGHSCCPRRLSSRMGHEGQMGSGGEAWGPLATQHGRGSSHRSSPAPALEEAQRRQCVEQPRLPDAPPCGAASGTSSQQVCASDVWGQTGVSASGAQAASGSAGSSVSTGLWRTRQQGPLSRPSSPRAPPDPGRPLGERRGGRTSVGGLPTAVGDNC